MTSQALDLQWTLEVNNEVSEQCNERCLELLSVRFYVNFKISLWFKDFRANVTLSGLDVTQTMNIWHVNLKIVPALCHIRTGVTLKSFGVTQAMNVSQVTLEAAFLRKLPAANLALVSSIRTLGSATALSMCGVVVRADRWLVVERHVADLTLDAAQYSLSTIQHKGGKTNML